MEDYRKLQLSGAGSLLKSW